MHFLFLVAPGPGRLQGAVPQRRKLLPPLPIHVLRVPQPQVAATLQPSRQGLVW